MFGFTDDAAVLIRSLIAGAELAGAELGADSGLRMSIDPQRRSLKMGLAARPGGTDRVLVHHAGVRVFVDPAASGRLHARTLDAQLTGPPAFFLRDR